MKLTLYYDSPMSVYHCIVITDTQTHLYQYRWNATSTHFYMWLFYNNSSRLPSAWDTRVINTPSNIYSMVFDLTHEMFGWWDTCVIVNFYMCSLFSADHIFTKATWIRSSSITCQVESLLETASDKNRSKSKSWIIQVQLLFDVSDPDSHYRTAVTTCSRR